MIRKEKGKKEYVLFGITPPISQALAVRLKTVMQLKRKRYS